MAYTPQKNKAEERVDFSKIKDVLEMPNLIEIQKQSYNWFLEDGISSVLNDIGTIKDFGGHLELKFLSHHFEEPKYSEHEAIIKDATYDASLKAITQLIDTKTGEIKEEEVYLGNIPKMTETGTFIINGAERVVVSQLVRSPGVYYILKKKKNNEIDTFHKIEFNPYRGQRLEFDTGFDKNDKKKEFPLLVASIDQQKFKMPANALLQALDFRTAAERKEGLPPQTLNGEDLMELFNHHPIIVNTVNRNGIKTHEGALQEVFKRLRPGDPFSLENASKLLHGLFQDPKRYDLSDAGRFKIIHKLMEVGPMSFGDTGVKDGNRDRIQKKLDAYKKNQILKKEDPSELPENDEEIGILNRQLMPADILFALKKFLLVLDSQEMGGDQQKIYPLDDIDHLGNRRLKSVGELLRHQFRIGASRLERGIKDKMSQSNIVKKSENGDSFDAENKDENQENKVNEETMVGLNYADMVINATQLINVKPLIAPIKEFFGSSQLSQFMDQTNPLTELTHKRRLSALGPGGLSRERAGFEVRDVHHSHYGRMCPIETPEGPNIGLIGALGVYGRVNKFGFIETPYRKVDKKNRKVTNEIVYLTADEEDKYRERIVKDENNKKKVEHYTYIIAQANTPIDENGYFIKDKVEARCGEDFLFVDNSVVDYMDVSPNQVWSIATALIPFLEHDDANRALMGANMQRQAVPLVYPESPVVGTGMEKRAAQDSGVCILAKEEGTVESSTSEEIVVKNSKGERDVYDIIKFKRSNQGTCINQKPIVHKGDKVKKGEVLADGPSVDRGELALGRNVLVAFMTWEGYNYEDAILISEELIQDDVYTSIHIEEYSCEARDTKLGAEEITREIPNVSQDAIMNLDEDGIIRIGAEVKAGDILVGKVTPKGETEPTAEEKLLRAIFGEKSRDVKDNSLRVPHGESGVIVDVKVFDKFDRDNALQAGVNKVVNVYIAQKRKISVGDKMAGRHGNKGVISRVLPKEDMPYLPDGTPVQIVLNPLGVPSRMNIGQVLECHLGLAATKKGIKIATSVFDGASEEDIHAMLDEVGQSRSGKSILYDGRSGIPFDNEVTVGYVYMLKLHHLVDDKMHARSTGPYSLVTQQPLGGKAQFGGQRFGEMEVWALEAYGAAHTLQEILTIKSDDIVGRVKTYEAIVKGENIPVPGVPESFKVLIKELQGLGLDIQVLNKDVEKDVFAEELASDRDITSEQIVEILHETVLSDEDKSELSETSAELEELDFGYVDDIAKIPEE